MITIDGKSYPLWSQFVEKKSEWIGGILEEIGDQFCKGSTTEITDITLEKDEDWGNVVVFTVHGKDFDCGFNIEYAGIDASNIVGNWIAFHGYGDFNFRIKQPTK
jgi:hypothetical protein